MWHKTDWNKVKEDPNSIAMPREDWIHFHDAETHAEDVFDGIFNKHLGTDKKEKPGERDTETVQPTIAT